MPTDQARPAHPPRRWRRDDRYRKAADGPEPTAAKPTGRLAVLAIVGGVLLLWLGLDLAFRSWKARYEALARFGATQVAPLVDPLGPMNPPSISPTQWRQAVVDTHAMLLALTAAGVLDQVQMDTLRRDVANRVDLARPETARSTLISLWDDLERDAGPLIAPSGPPTSPRQATRHPRPPRPAILGPSRARPADRIED